MNNQLHMLHIASLLLSLLVIYSLTCSDQVATKHTCSLDCLLMFSSKRLDAVHILISYCYAWGKFDPNDLKFKLWCFCTKLPREKVRCDWNKLNFLGGACDTLTDICPGSSWSPAKKKSFEIFLGILVGPYQILVTFFNFLGTLPKFVVQLIIQFTTKIFFTAFLFYPSKCVSMATRQKL